MAFEAESIDPFTGEGCVVEVRELAQNVTDGIVPWSERVRATPVEPWVAGPHEPPTLRSPKRKYQGDDFAAGEVAR